MTTPSTETFDLQRYRIQLDDEFGHAPGRTVVLMVEAAGVQPTGD